MCIKEEKSIEIERLVEEIPSDLVTDMLGKKCVNIQKIGSLSMFRKVCTAYDGVEICLDHNSYLEKEDYELEVEYDTEELNEKVKVLLKSLFNISFDKKSKGN